MREGGIPEYAFQAVSVSSSPQRSPTQENADCKCSIKSAMLQSAICDLHCALSGNDDQFAAHPAADVRRAEEAVAAGRQRGNHNLVSVAVEHQERARQRHLARPWLLRPFRHRGVDQAMRGIG